MHCLLDSGTVEECCSNLGDKSGKKNCALCRNGIVSNKVCFSCNFCYGVAVDSIDNRGEKALKDRLGRGL